MKMTMFLIRSAGLGIDAAVGFGVVGEETAEAVGLVMCVAVGVGDGLRAIHAASRLALAATDTRRKSRRESSTGMQKL